MSTLNPTPIPITLPTPWEYDEAVTILLRNAHDGFFQADGMLGDIRRLPTRHSGPSRIDIREQAISTPQQDYQVEVLIPKEVLDDMDEVGFAAAIAEMSQGFLRAATRTVFDHLSTITSATGMEIDAGGRPFSHDLFLDMVERVDMAFDDEGNVTGTNKLYVSPAMARKLEELPPPTPEHWARHDAIIARKREEWNAKKRTRRLS